MAEINQKQKILIVGGGFGGISCALNLAKKNPADVEIGLVSNKPYFEYTPALYRVLAGKSARGACVPIAEILKGKRVSFIEDTITDINLAANSLKGTSGNIYQFDYLVLALGSEAAYFSVPGLKDFSFAFKSVSDAVRLKQHIHDTFKRCLEKTDDVPEDVCRLHFVVVGAGASGVEMAGDLIHYARKLAGLHCMAPSFVTVDLFEAAPRILPMFPEKISEKVEKRLRSLGVNIFVNRPITEEQAQKVTFGGISLKTDTVIWTAGTKPNSLYGQIKGFELDKKSKVVVDEYLRAEGYDNIFAIGDGASTRYSGLAQTAIEDGKWAAENIARAAAGHPPLKHRPKKPIYVIPLGPGWAAVEGFGPFNLFGYAGLLLRDAADFRYFLSILPWPKVLKIFFQKRNLCQACGICP